MKKLLAVPAVCGILAIGAPILDAPASASQHAHAVTALALTGSPDDDVDVDVDLDEDSDKTGLWGLLGLLGLAGLIGLKRNKHDHYLEHPSFTVPPQDPGLRTHDTHDPLSHVEPHVPQPPAQPPTIQAGTVPPRPPKNKPLP